MFGLSLLKKHKLTLSLVSLSDSLKFYYPLNLILPSPTPLPSLPLPQITAMDSFLISIGHHWVWEMNCIFMHGDIALMVLGLKI